MKPVKFKEKINKYLDNLPTSKLEEIAIYIEQVYQAEQSKFKIEKQPSELGKKLRAIRA